MQQDMAPSTSVATTALNGAEKQMRSWKPTNLKAVHILYKQVPRVLVQLNELG